ncbi:MAG TPA: ABC transporter ATP-binding protein [Solirubrobacteraceae bacterium]|nr:ABC transporter ATP-binding protein [Solirubrobacteraceae bacterium]
MSAAAHLRSEEAGAPRPPSSATAAVVELVGISKAFPGVVANDDISFDVRRGEVHCLLGENGAGKSTLIGILSGIQRPDSGLIRVDGEDVDIGSPRDALRLGIGTVYQHSTLIPALSVLENLMLGDTHKLRLDGDSASERLREIGSTLGVEVDPSAKASDLALGRQQQVEIIKALWRGSRLLILDEPTSMLTPQAVEELYKVLSRLKENGLAIIFITHKLHEAAFLGDRISVLRRGQLIGTLDEPAVKAATPHELEKRIVEMMFGDAAGGLADAAELKAELSVTDDLVYEAEPVRTAAEEVLKLERVSVRGEGAEPGLDDVSLTLHLGEILGVAGVDGNGQRALAETVSGQRRLQRGELRFFGAPIGHVGVTGRQKLGLRYLTDDRLGEGIVSGLPVSINMFLKRIGEAPFWRQGRIRKQAIDDRAKELVERFDVRTPSVDTRAGTLSGGNVQKVLLARELSFDSKVVIFHKPTYGLDLKTTRSVRQMIREMRDGKAALVISTDLDELLEVSDRIAVLSRGRIVGEVKPGPGAAEEVGRLMIGDVSLGAEPERGAA